MPLRRQRLLQVRQSGRDKFPSGPCGRSPLQRSTEAPRLSAGAHRYPGHDQTSYLYHCRPLSEASGSIQPKDSQIETISWPGSCHNCLLIMDPTSNMHPKDRSSQQSANTHTNETTHNVRASSEKTTSNAGSVTAKEPDPEPEYLEGTKLYLLFSSLLLTVLIMTIDTSVVSTAIPRITDQFHTIKDIG